VKAIFTKFHGPSNVKGSRISATDEDGNRVMVSSDHALSQDGRHDKAALALCQKMRWTGVLIRGGLKGGNVYVFLDDSAVVHIQSGEGQ
jgi:hypothetical protein